MTDVADLIRAARVPATFKAWDKYPYNAIRRPLLCLDPEFDDYVVLSHVCMEGLHLIQGDNFGGYIVMEDSRGELKRHLPILMRGHGRLLITGLGLGCVVRGLLSKQSVQHIDVIEIEDVMLDKMGGEFESDPRVTLHHGNALEVDIDGEWNFAWHDIYCDGNDGLQTLHSKLLLKWREQCDRQGAWMFPRWAKKQTPEWMIN